MAMRPKVRSSVKISIPSATAATIAQMAAADICSLPSFLRLTANARIHPSRKSHMI